MKFFTALIISSFFVGLTGCSTTQENPHFKTMSASEVEKVIEANSQNKKLYDGFMNKMDVTATIHNQAVTQALHDQSARIYQWDAPQYAAEKAKTETSQASKTEFFLSFFVPERKWDDLHKSQTKWKIFLDVGGKRYEGKATRWRANISEVQSFYPYHTRWNTPYRVSFDVPEREIENNASRLTITGPVGALQLDFGAPSKTEETAPAATN